MTSEKIKNQSADPLHGITLEKILKELVSEYGWEKLHEMIKINCFLTNPSIKSSLTFLRKTPWARLKVEKLYIQMMNSLANISQFKGNR